MAQTSVPVGPQDATPPPGGQGGSPAGNAPSDGDWDTTLPIQLDPTLINQFNSLRQNQVLSWVEEVEVVGQEAAGGMGISPRIDGDFSNAPELQYAMAHLPPPPNGRVYDPEEGFWWQFRNQICTRGTRALAGSASGAVTGMGTGTVVGGGLGLIGGPFAGVTASGGAIIGGTGGGVGGFFSGWYSDSLGDAVYYGATDGVVSGVTGPIPVGAVFVRLYRAPVVGPTCLIIGESMTRVRAWRNLIPGAVIHDDAAVMARIAIMEANGAADYEIESYLMQQLRPWFLGQLRSGRRIFDIGIDESRSVRSVFYNVESIMTRNYQILHPN